MLSHSRRFIAAALAATVFSFLASCGEGGHPVGPPVVVYCPDGSVAPGNDISRCPPPPPPVETVSVSGSVSVSFIGVAYPMAKVTITGSGQSTIPGNTVTVAVTVNNTPSTLGNITLPEGSYRVCFVGTSSTGVKSSEWCPPTNLAITWPSIRGRFVAATPTSEYVPSGLWAVVEDVDSVRVNPDGTYFIPTLMALRDTAKVVVRGSSEVFPTLARVEKKYFSNYVQIGSVKNWTIFGAIPGCTYAGQTIGLSLEKAYKRTPPQGNGFFPRWKLSQLGGTDSTTYAYLVGSYTSYPVKVAIFKGRTDTPFSASAEDEARLWARLAEMNPTMCFDTFVRSDDTVSVNTSGGVRVNFDATRFSGGVNEETKGDYVFGTVNIGPGSDGTISALLPQYGGTAKHEFFHASGPIHHTCQFNPPSLMTQNCNVNQANDMTAEDVAYWHLMRRVRELERKYSTRFSLAQMHQGENVFLLGLPEDKVIVFGPEGFSW